MTDYIGKSVLRFEDKRFLSGEGHYTADLRFDKQLHAVFLRSPYPHARIKSINLTNALGFPGVRAIFHGEALAKAGLQPINTLNTVGEFALRNRDGSLLPDPRRWPLARKKVRFVGEPVAIVVADKEDQARDAVEAVQVDYEVLEPVMEFQDALHADSALVWDELSSNICVDYESGDRDGVDAAFQVAKTVVSVDAEYPRHVVAFMEPRTVVAEFNAQEDRFVVYTGGQSPHWMQAGVAEVLNVDKERVRIVIPDTGGGFGARTWIYPEMAVLGYAAQQTGQPVKWTAERWESFATDTQSRDHSMRITLSFDENCKITAIRLSSHWRLGAYLAPRSVWLHATYMALVQCGIYKIPLSHYELKGAFTNTAQIAAFRGVGRAESSYAVERAMDCAAAQLKVSATELRSWNMIRLTDLPWTAPTGAKYVSGNYERGWEKIIDDFDLDAYRERCRISHQSGQCRGIGYSVFLDSTGGAPNEYAEVRVLNESVEVRVGTKSIGTSHETVFAQVLASQLQIDLNKVKFIDGDTDLVKTGSGTHASRSLRIAGAAIVHCVEKVIEQAKEVVADHLEVRAGDIEYGGGIFRVAGTDRCMGLFDVSASMETKGNSLSAEHEYCASDHVYVSGAQSCEVEVDPETGTVRIDRIVSVSDPGVLVNPQVAEGQIHGGIVNGIGHALLEKAEYDPSSGQLVTASFMDYAIPKADDVPQIECHWNAVPSDENPLGVKGIGEIGITGAPSAIMNAIHNALKHFGEVEIQMPATSERVWKAIHHARMKKRG